MSHSITKKSEDGNIEMIIHHSSGNTYGQIRIKDVNLDLYFDNIRDENYRYYITKVN